MESTGPSSAHTPGPWMQVLNLPHLIKQAEPYAHSPHIVGEVIASTDIGNLPPGERLANARLIAVAPSLHADGQALYDAIQQFLLENDIPDGALPCTLVHAFDRFAATWNAAWGVGGHRVGSFPPLRCFIQFLYSSIMEPFTTLPFISLYEVDGEVYRYPVRLFRADENLCELSGAGQCDTTAGVYYGCDPDAGKLCPRHFYEDHFGPDANCKLVDCPSVEADRCR